ncbi:AAA family ATPase [Marinomonas sp. IMCC 4694]|uniref:AAA family ATPase n=1 Tax=Marinomonas sp. IMCC 4694 TaxID=2605432 RepID=UPI0011E64CFD|nr:AAA family ATPase [Marinomonas sp. IMCC 4694]TYL46516.1 AAA family ATPase [Marinomonas sp. IMCC 4694]
MKIKSLHLKHFRRFDDFEISFDPKLTVLVAKNGAGKTSILDGIAISLGPFLTRLPSATGKNFKEMDFQILQDGMKPPYMRIRSESFNGIVWDRTEKRDKSKKTAEQIPEAIGLKALFNHVDSFADAFNSQEPFQLPIFAYFGAGRGVFDIPQRKRSFSKKCSRFDSFKGALESRTNFKSFVEYFYSLEDLETLKQKEARSFDFVIPELKAIRSAVNAMIPAFSNPRGAYPAGIEVDWCQDEIKNTLRIEQLSDGYRTTLAMVMDIAARMAEANPDVDDPLQTEGVVMIDEVDLHLHPGWQQTMLLDLMRTFPSVQFIVTTHSPQVISSVKPSSLRVIDWKDDKPVLIPIAFSEGAEAQQVLLDVLGLKSPRVESLDIVKDLEKYQHLVELDKWDSKEAVYLRKILDQWGAGHEPELARLDMDIRMKEWEREQI